VIACHACGAAITLDPLGKIGVRDVCDHCRAYLHSCRQCDFYELGAHNDCRESNAEMVADKEAGNFCDYFRVASPKKASKGAGNDTRAALDRLFQKS